MNIQDIAKLEALLKVQEMLYGEGSSEVAVTMCKIADLHVENCHYIDAETLYRRAISIQARLTGPYRADLLETTQRLEDLLITMGQKTVDSHYPTSWIDDDDDDDDDEHDDEECYIDEEPPSSSYHDSDPVFASELEVELLKQSLGDDHLALAEGLTRLADIYWLHEMDERMEPVLKEALRINEHHFGPNHAGVATALKDLALLYISQRRYTMAEPLLKRALDIRMKMFSKIDPRVTAIAEVYDKLLTQLQPA